MNMSVRPRHYPHMGKIMVFNITQKVDIRLYISCAMIIGVVKPLYCRELRLSGCKSCGSTIFLSDALVLKLHILCRDYLYLKTLQKQYHNLCHL